MRSGREKFTIYLDVKHFAPDDLNVKVTDDYVEIKGKHGERQVFISSDMNNVACFLLLLMPKTINIILSVLKTARFLKYNPIHFSS